MADPPSSFPPLVPRWAAVRLTHAALQALADDVGVDIIHIKGPTDADLREGIHDSLDADVMVRPAHVDEFLSALELRGWSKINGFQEGSPFDHAANYQHPAWVWVDVHRYIPGFRASADEVFERFWAERERLEIAHWSCVTLSARGRVLVQVMHVARSHGRDRPETWTRSTESLRSSVRQLAEELGGQVAFAAGVGELAAHRADPEYHLWRYWSQPNENRIAEWIARVRTAPGIRARGRVLAQAVRVNRAGLRARLGREPSIAEVLREQAKRLGHAAASAWAIVTSRSHPSRTGDGE